MNLTLAEVAKRIQTARYCCDGRTQPCGSCTSAVYQGCIYLAAAVLDSGPLRLPAPEQFPDHIDPME